MMSALGQPPAYAPLDQQGLLALAAPHLPGAPESAQEIGDGNLNLVFRVRGGGGSVIVKQALPYLRVVGDAWPLTLDRARIEAEALTVHGGLAPGRVPRLLHHDAALAALVLEDLGDHEVWRRALVAGRDVEGVAAQLGDYCARTLLGTSDVLMPPDERKALALRFSNPELCAITEDLVFTSPYIDSPSNRYDDAAAEAAAELRRDRSLRRAAAMLRFRFRTRAEALVHGDLHSGSVLVAPGDARAFDHEFAFMGPMGFDLGNVLANLALARAAHEVTGNAAFARTIDAVAAEFWDAFVAGVGRLWPPSEPWREPFVAGVLADAGDYAGVEMIRRIVGLAHVADVDELPDGPRLVAQRTALACGRHLLLGGRATAFTDLWTRATREEPYA
jgi:5-methylthioribose kinase